MQRQSYNFYAAALACLFILLAPATPASAMGPRPSAPAEAPAANSPDNAEMRMAPDFDNVPVMDNDVEPKFRQAAFILTRFLQEEHFARRPVDNQVATEWITTFMRDLDYLRLFFLQSDVDDAVARYAPGAADSVRAGDMEAAFDIYNLLTLRAYERARWIHGRFDRPFRFDGDDFFNPDRLKADWPADAAAADEVWEKRLKYDILQDRLVEDSADSKDKPLTMDEIIIRLEKRYDRIMKNMTELDKEEVIKIYLSSLAKIYDPHSQYLSPSDMEDFRISMQNSLFGIGAVLATEDGYCVVREVISGGPADIDGRLSVNDRIVAVGQGEGGFTDIVDMRLRNAVRLIRGPKGTAVRLSVIPADAADSSVRREINLIRDEIRITEYRARAKVIDLPNGADGFTRLGIIEIPSFYGDIDGTGKNPPTTEDVERLIGEVKKKNIEGLVLDLRNNGGGLLSEAVRLTGLFIERGPVVQIKDARGRRQVLEDTSRETAYDGPLVVLTNKMSASASEIVAGALQNYGRAIVVGDKSTHGKGTVQTVQDLGRFLVPIGGGEPDAGAVKLTIQKFYLPNGHSTQKRGIVPDIVLPSPNDYLEIGEATLPHVLPWDEISASNYRPLGDLSPLALSLATSSQKRIAATPEYLQLNEDIERLRLRLEDRRVSLNEERRIRERNEDKARRDAREAAIKELASEGPTMITITFDKDEGITITAGDAPAPRLGRSEDEEDVTSSERLAADLHLRETLNILHDLVRLDSAGAEIARATRPALTP